MGPPISSHEIENEKQINKKAFTAKQAQKTGMDEVFINLGNVYIIHYV